VEVFPGPDRTGSVTGELSGYLAAQVGLGVKQGGHI
jgi:hypothetical protein